MRISKRAKYVLAAPVFVVATVAAQLTHVIPTYAATLTWTGGGDGTTFSDGSNWNTGIAPVDGDALTFSSTALSDDVTVNNDISGLSVTGISFTGTMNEYYTYTLQGNELTVSGSIANATTGTGAEYATPVIENDLTLSGTTTVSAVNIGTVGSTLNLQSYGLSLIGDQGCGQVLYSDLSGSGSLSIAGTLVNVRGANASYSGAISVTGKAYVASSSFGNTATGTTVAGAGELYVVNSTSGSLGEPFTFGGTGSFGSVQNFAGCAGGSGPAETLTLTGGVTLNSDFVYDGYNNLIINEPYTSNGHNFTVAGGANGTLTTPSGEVAAPTETIPLDGDSSTYVNVGNNQTAVLNGTRDGIGVQNGGTLKGTGTATTLSVDDGGTVAPGNSPGTLTVLESLTLSGTYEAEILNASTYDKLAVGEDYSGGGNAVFLNSGATLNAVLYDGWKVTQGDKFTIIDNLSSTAVMGTFEGLAEGTQIVIDGITFSISYVGGDGNDVVLTALNTGSDPSTPNTGVQRFIAANPLVIAVFGLVSAGLLLAIALRRKTNR